MARGKGVGPLPALEGEGSSPGSGDNTCGFTWAFKVESWPRNPPCKPDSSCPQRLELCSKLGLAASIWLLGTGSICLETLRAPATATGSHEPSDWVPGPALPGLSHGAGATAGPWHGWAERQLDCAKVILFILKSFLQPPLSYSPFPPPLLQPCKCTSAPQMHISPLLTQPWAPLYTPSIQTLSTPE